MVDDDIPKYPELLKQQYHFQGLDDAQLAHVINRLERQEFEAGRTIFAQGERGDRFYILFKGRVRITRKDGVQERQLNLLTPGDYFGDEALLFDRPRTTNAIAAEPVVLLSLDRAAFFALMAEFPDIRLNLSATAESRYLVRRENFDWIGDDEVIYLIARKHELFLIVSLILPVIMLVASIPLIVSGFSAQTPFFIALGIGGGVLLSLGGILLGIWNWVDWGNDYYIVTNQRVVWLERVIIFYYSRREAPLTQVLAVNVRSSFWGQVFRYGDVDVRTFTGGILMKKCTNPKRFASFIEGYQNRARRLQKEAEAETIERELRQRLGLDPAPPPAAAETSRPVPLRKPRRKVKPGSLQDKLDTFLQVRFERDGVITYRKHWLVLIWKTWQPTLGFLILLGVTIYLLWFRLVSDPVLGVSLFLGLFLLYLGVLIWWGYHYWDWSDDIYQLTPDQIFDIEKKPLGEEDKKSAPLDSILSLEHTRLGLIQLIFNYGDVVINVGQTQFTFRGVYNPDRVHQDVSDYIEARRRKKLETEAGRERQRMLDWFGSYQRQTEILEEKKNESDWDIFPG